MKKLLYLLPISIVLFILAGLACAPVVPDYKPPYEDFEIIQGVAIRPDHVCIMTIKTVDRKGYVGITGGYTDNIPGGPQNHGNIMKVLFKNNYSDIYEWNPTESGSYHLSLLGGYGGQQVWGVKIPREQFVYDSTDDSHYFAWCFPYGIDWSYVNKGVAPFININDFYNACGRLLVTVTPTGPVDDEGNPTYTKEDYDLSGAYSGL